MALDVWYKSDIQNVLSAAEQACRAALGAAGDDDDPFVAGYEAGYRSALVTVALAFGLVRASGRHQTRTRPLTDDSLASASGSLRGQGGGRRTAVSFDPRFIQVCKTDYQVCEED